MSSGTRNNKALVFLVIILLLSNIGLLFYFLVYRQPAKKTQGAKNDFSLVDYMKKEIGFNEDQTRQFQQLHDQNRDSLKQIGDSVRSAKANLYKLIQSTATPSDSSVNQALQAISYQQQRMEIMMLRHFQKVRSILNADQQIKFDTMVNRMNNRPPWMRKGGMMRQDSSKPKN